ncbi:MAG: hypothetical protein ACFN4O_01415 [Anaeroglobus sp.]
MITENVRLQAIIENFIYQKIKEGSCNQSNYLLPLELKITITIAEYRELLMMLAEENAKRFKKYSMGRK